MEPEDQKGEEKQGGTPEEKPAEKDALSELQKKYDDLMRHAKNKEEEATRVQKKVEAFEAAEKERAEAQLSKEQLLEKQKADAEAEADKAVAMAKQAQDEADAKLLKAAFLLKAKDMGFENPSDAYALAEKNIPKKDDGEFDEVSIETALKPLIGRLPIKKQGDGKGSSSFPPPPSKTRQSEKTGRAFKGTY